jgi:LysR family hydrogen peroxide-inducible transcriptional activator
MYAFHYLPTFVQTAFRTLTMDLRQIRYFLNLTETLNFTRAAVLSQVTQPALTKAIQKLEEELGGQLLFRDGKDTRLTELGRTIRGEFEKIVASEMKARELADHVVHEGRTLLSIGVASTLGPEPVSGFLDEFLSEMRQVEVIIDSINQDVAEELVLSGGLDACFCVDADGSNPKLRSIPLYEERLLAATAADHRFAQMAEIPTAELAHENYIDRVNCEFRRRVIDHFMDHDLLMRPQLRSDREDWVQRAIARGFGVAMLPERAVMLDGIRLTPVRGMDLSRSVCLLTVFGSASAPAVRRLADAAKRYVWLSSEL